MIVDVVLTARLAGIPKDERAVMTVPPITETMDDPPILNPTNAATTAPTAVSSITIVIG